jgi:hypothetical protein
MHLEPRANPLQEAFTSIFNNLTALGTSEPRPKFPAAWEISGRKIEFVRKIVEIITNYPLLINQLRVEWHARRGSL